MESVNNVRGVLDLDSAELNVLTGGNVHDSDLRAVLLDAVGVKTHLFGVNDAVRDLEAHHELARGALVPVEHAYPFQSRVEVGRLHLLPCHLPFPDLPGVLVHVDEGRRTVLGQLDLFNLGSDRGAFEDFLRKKRFARRLSRPFVDFGLDHRAALAQLRRRGGAEGGGGGGSERPRAAEEGDDEQVPECHRSVCHRRLGGEMRCVDGIGNSAAFAAF
mmetsp:Transcript_33522/g.99905  ORF Transcript_33522/g.99905 Transcript_33522/m.99905 type:complete len:217 (+) Transcript_33522:1830-2480(+)